MPFQGTAAARLGSAVYITGIPLISIQFLSLQLWGTAVDSITLSLTVLRIFHSTKQNVTSFGLSMASALDSGLLLLVFTFTTSHESTGCCPNRVDRCRVFNFTFVPREDAGERRIVRLKVKFNTRHQERRDRKPDWSVWATARVDLTLSPG